MNYKHVLISLALAIPSLGFAGDKCNYTPSAQKYWNTQLSALIVHGKKAFLAGDYIDVKFVLAVSKAAITVSCLSKPRKDFLALAEAMATVDMETTMLDAAKLIAKSDYRLAHEKLEDVAYLATEHGLKTPEGQPVLLRTANEGLITLYFMRLDRDVADEVITEEKALLHEKDACIRAIPALKVPTPERCRKYQ